MFHCHVSGVPYPRVNWKRGDGRTASMEKRNNKFYFHDVEVKDSGLYSCIADNNFGHKSVCNTTFIVIGKTRYNLMIKKSKKNK